MSANEQLISKFYQAFQNKDFKTMQNCYDDKAVFNDEVFKNLDARQVRMMWEMLIKRGRDLNIEFKNINTNEKEGSVQWEATYTFTQTKRKVTNEIKASFKFENDRIIQHTDHFNFYKWSRQAFGVAGFFLGWTPMFKGKVRQETMKDLHKYIGENHNN